MTREDTVVSRLPDFSQRQQKKARSGDFDGSATRVRRAVASLDNVVPPAPRGWDNRAQAPLRVVPQAPPQTMTKQRVAPPAAPRTAAPSRPRPSAQRAQIVPIPEVCYEPSVVAAIPAQQLAMAQMVADQVVAEQEQTPAGQGRVLVMFSCRGGSGATTLAVNTAASLVRSGKSVCIIDLDMQLGDVFVAMDLDAPTSIAALAREASTIDGAALKRRLARHDSGVYALSQTGQVDDVDANLIERMPALLATLSSHFDFVIVDGVRDFDDYALSVLDMADHIGMVITQDVASVRRAARAIELFRRLGYSDSKVDLLLNRYKRSADVSEIDILRALSLPVKARVRNNYKRMQSAFNDGSLIGEVARNSGVAKDLDKLAKLYADRAQVADTTPSAAPSHTDKVEKQKGGLFSFLRFLPRGSK